MSEIVDPADDFNHLLLSCHLASELGTGLRYAYSRLDTIDRKASELFRSFTWIFGLLGGLTAVGGHAFRWPRWGDPTSLQTLVAVGFIPLLGITIGMTRLHKSISGLRYYRIGAALLDAATLPAAQKLDARNTRFGDYIREISSVTVHREQQLATMARLHSAGLALSGVLLLCLVAPSALAPECPCR